MCEANSPNRYAQVD